MSSLRDCGLNCGLMKTQQVITKQQNSRFRLVVYPSAPWTVAQPGPRPQWRTGSWR